MSSLVDKNRGLRKQIGCVTGIFQLFDRQHYLTSWRVSSHNNKILLSGTQHQLNSQDATRADVDNIQDAQMKQRVSMSSSRASNLSSSCSSTISSLDSHRTARLESLQRKQSSVYEGAFDLRDVVKGPMYRESRCVPVKTQTNDKSRSHVMKHIDSPRPLLHKSGKPETNAYEGSTRFLAKFQENTINSRDVLLALPRLSCDGRESRETFQSTGKKKELPRLSLDSKASSTQCSFLESRMNLPSREHLQMERKYYSQVLPSKQESGSQNRSSGVVAKLMGLDAFPDTVSTEKSRIIKIELRPKQTFLPKSSTTIETSKQNKVPYSLLTSLDNPTSASPGLHSASSVRKQTESSRFPVEPAPWRQQHSTQGSRKKASESRKARPSSSIYDEIEKRVAELEFKKSGKDLRALKQILEGMQKTRERLKTRIEEPDKVASQNKYNFGDSFSDQNSSLSILHNTNNYHKVPNNMDARTPTPSVSYIVIKKSAEMTHEKRESRSNQLTEVEIPRQQRIKIQDLKHDNENSAQRERAKDLTPRNRNLKYTSRHLPSIENKITRTSELEGTLKAPRLTKAESCASSGRSLGALSPRLRKNLPRKEGQSNSNVPTSSDSGRAKSHSRKKIVEKDLQNKNCQTKSKYLDLSDDQLTDFSCETRFSSSQGDSASINSESNNSLASHAESKVLISLAHSTNPKTNRLQHYVPTSIESIAAAELPVTTQEQPSPVSVLGAAFCGEDSPSPIKKILPAFRDQSPFPDEANRHLENLNHLIDFALFDHSQRGQMLILLKSRPEESAQNQNETGYGSLDPDQRHINKVLQTSGLLKGASLVPTANKFLSSCHAINPDKFNVFEKTEETMARENKELIEKTQKIDRKIVSDIINEMLVRKVNSGGLFTARKKSISPQVLAKEVYLEMYRLCRVPDRNFDEEDDGLKRILTGDLMYQSEDWAEYSGEIPALVFDIERQIFKDLVNEVVAVECANVHDRPKRHSKQLFTL